MNRYIDANLISYEQRDRLGLGIDYGTTDRSTYEIAYKSQIDKIPTADVEEVRYGKWIKDEREVRGDGEIYDYCCSSCKSPAAEGSYGNHDVLTPYCSQCGAKMDREEEK